ncbi:hypothetical protein GLOIN_2v188984 [Rhizophagus irregularis DAOM 181602=DAOM 197198]|nr:hypothetical protein GLOIN_2v188984 [Rhizophagus irregularis DAOM 181602=DAOM 197198]
MGELNSDVYIRDPHMLWQNGIIPYEFNNKVINNLRQYVEIAMKEISKVTTEVLLENKEENRNYQLPQVGKIQLVLLYTNYSILVECSMNIPVLSETSMWLFAETEIATIKNLSHLTSTCKIKQGKKFLPCDAERRSKEKKRIISIKVIVIFHI